MLLSTIIGCSILGYLFIGLVIVCIELKIENTCLDKIEVGFDIFMPMFLWPILVFAYICFGISWGAKKIFRFVALYVLKIPATTPNSGETPPPQKVVEDTKSTSRSDLIDIE